MVINWSGVQETWVLSLGQKDPLEKGMATHSSILAWEIPLTEKSGGGTVHGDARVGQDWVTNLSLSLLTVFIFFASLGSGSYNILLWFKSKSSLPMFSSEFHSVGLIVRCLMHLGFIFVYGARKCSNFIILHGAVQFFQHHLLKRLSFLHCVFFPSLSYIRWP